MSFYRRRLPHWHPDNKDLFITWTLSGAIPRKLYLPPKVGETFLTIDRLLDGASQGPKWLRNPEIAHLVVTALHHSAGELKHYELHA